VANLVMLSGRGKTNAWSRSRTQSEVGPDEVLGTKPNSGSGRHGPTIADPIMYLSDRRQHTVNYRREKQSHQYRMSGYS